MKSSSTVVLAGALVLTAITCQAGELPPNEWVKVSENAVGPRRSPALVWSKKLKRYVIIGSLGWWVKKKKVPWDVQSFDPKARKWSNDLPAGAEKYEGDDGFCTDPGFKTPYYIMGDKAGLPRPQSTSLVMQGMYLMAPWDGLVYSIVCGRTLGYSPEKRAWKELKPKGSPCPPSVANNGTLNWSALCADPERKEIVLFGGCGIASKRSGPGTWVYSVEKNEWRDLKLEKQPPPRALSQMAYDPATKKMVLFGGEGLDRCHGDTWVFDCEKKTWEERKPALAPSPRYRHAMLLLPKSKKVVLMGGSAYGRKQPEYEVWTYDVAGNKWELVKRFEKGKLAPLYYRAGSYASVTAVDDEDTVLTMRGGVKKVTERSCWMMRVDPAKTDAAGTAKYGVKPSGPVFRGKYYDPAWYEKDVPPVDEKAQAAFLKNLKPNEFVHIKAPKWPYRSYGGGWSTVALDTDRDIVLLTGGGHATYYGSDLACYDIKKGRWFISYRPQFALNYNGTLTGAGPFAFGGRPWQAHWAHNYTYDSTIKRLVLLDRNGQTQFYDPDIRDWRFEERVKTNFKRFWNCSAAITVPKGVVAWTYMKKLFLLEKGKNWVPLKIGGDIPGNHGDASTAVYDSKRDRLLMTTTVYPHTKVTVQGQVWSYEFKTGKAGQLNPVNKDAVVCGRFARESVYLPKLDMMMLGYLLKVDGKLQVPFYDCAKNQWLVAQIPGSDMIAKKQGDNTSLGMVYDPKRDLTWMAHQGLGKNGRLRVMRVDSKTLKLKPLKRDK